MRDLIVLKPLQIPEVRLQQAPLVGVIAQVRFPAILAIRNPDKVAKFQEALRQDYPFLIQEHVNRIELAGIQTPNVHSGIIWRLTDKERDAQWRVSLGIDFVALETSLYDSRNDFLNRIGTVVSAVEKTFEPASASRVGLRYVDQLVDEAVARISEIVQPSILGIVGSPRETELNFRDSITRSLTETEILAPNGARIQARWGQLPPNTTYDPNILDPIDKMSWILDLDMFKLGSHPFDREALQKITSNFAECIYWLFRQIVTDEFLKFYGGQP